MAYAKSGRAVTADAEMPNVDFVNRVKQSFVEKHSRAIAELHQRAAEQQAIWDALAIELSPGKSPPEGWQAGTVAYATEEAAEESGGESSEECEGVEGEQEACEELHRVLSQP